MFCTRHSGGKWTQRMETWIKVHENRSLKKNFCSTDSLKGQWDTWLPTYDLRGKEFSLPPNIAHGCTIHHLRESIDLQIGNLGVHIIRHFNFNFS